MLSSYSKFIPQPAYGIEMLLMGVMAMAMMGAMGGQQQQDPAPTPEPTKPEPMPDPNAKAMNDSKAAEDAALQATQDGRSGTNLSSRNVKLGSASTPSDQSAPGSDYSGSVLGG
jgi:hypothetical protein